MRPSLDDLRAVAERAVSLAPADEAEALVIGVSSALTRFANNRIHQNVAEADTIVTVRALVGTRTGVSMTNRLDTASLERCACSAAEAASHAPEDPGFPGLPGPQPVPDVERSVLATRAFDEERRAAAARSIIGESRERGLVAAGTVAMRDAGVAIANSRGVDVAASTAEICATILSTGPDGASGWASAVLADAAAFDPVALGAGAADTAARSAGRHALDPGVYTVVLAPEAVAELLAFLGYLGFGAKAYAEGTSFLADAVGTQLTGESISVYDDALEPGMVGLPFDCEGQPKRRVPLITSGIACSPVTDSYYAHLLALPNTGHALPAPNAHGPLPLNLVMAEGTSPVQEMIASVERGVYVSRFHYVNVEDPMRAILTGMTRDGTFTIESGRLGAPLRNLRFTQDILEALRHVGAVGAGRRLVASEDGAATLAPALLLERWTFTGQTGE